MPDEKIKVLEVSQVTHDVIRFKTTKPSNLSFKPGQATELSINTPALVSKKRPFTFTSLPSDEHLEFTIKIYPDHEDGMTQHLKDLKPGSEFLISEVFGAIQYKGPGVFIAGGAGITPFISILRSLRISSSLQGNTLIFSNKTDKDIINEEELSDLQDLGLRLILTVTRTPSLDPQIDNKRIDSQYLKNKISNFSKNFYICGPPTMVGELQSALQQIGAKPESLIFET
jgi:ferredoxin-NADP reductase